MLRADAAMLVLAGVLLTFFSAQTTSNGAGLHGSNNRLLVATRAPRSERTSRQTHIGAVKVQPDALSHLRDHLFGETGIRTRGARLGTGVALLNALDQNIIGASGDVGMGSNHVLHMVHGHFLLEWRAPTPRISKVSSSADGVKTCNVRNGSRADPRVRPNSCHTLQNYLSPSAEARIS